MKASSLTRNPKQKDMQPWQSPTAGRCFIATTELFMKMLPCLCCTLVFTGTLLAQSPPDIAKPQTPVAGAVSVNSSNRIARAADGRRYIINEVKVTLRDEFAQKLQQNANAGQPLDHEPMRRLHPAIESVKAGHLTGRNFLNNEPLPKVIRQKPGQTPRIARMLTFVLKPGFDAARVVPELLALPEIESANLSELLSLNLVPNDTYYSNQWAPAKIGLTNAWDILPRGEIKVAIVDVGLDVNHPEFAGRIVYGAGFGDDAPSNGDAPADGRNEFDHGTHVAGIVAAGLNNGMGVAGFGDAIELMAMGCAKWVDDQGKYTIQNGDDAIIDAVAHGARVINCSFGSRSDLPSSMDGALDAAYLNDVMVVVAAGNDAASVDGVLWSQSHVPFIISATDQNDAIASFSDFGNRINLAAPGVAIYSTVPRNSSPPYAYKSGTSMAAPMVTGAAALIMSMNPNLIEDNSTIDLLIRMATDLGPPGHDAQFGDGRLFLSAPTLRAVRAADAFVSSVQNPFGQDGSYEQPWLGLPTAFLNVPDGSVLVLNGGVVAQSSYNYPPITITKRCTLTAIPDRPVVIGH
jgi:subtilisin family serine protease